MTITQELFDAAFNSGAVRYPDECALIVSTVLLRLGIKITPRQAEEVWDTWSSRMDASWLGVCYSDEDEILAAVNWFVRGRLEGEIR
jgi:hypothetical protein